MLKKLLKFLTSQRENQLRKEFPPSFAFAGDIGTLSLRESALGAKIRMSERSEFGFLSLLLADLRKVRVSGSETRKLRETLSGASPSVRPLYSVTIFSSINFCSDIRIPNFA